KPAAAAIDAELESIAESHDLDVRGRVQDIVGGTGAPAATADQADLDDVVAGRMDVGQQAQVCRHRRSPDRRGLQELPAGSEFVAHGLLSKEVTGLDDSKAQGLQPLGLMYFIHSRA